MSLSSKMYKDGAIFGEFKSSTESLFKAILEMNTNPRDGFFWEMKYPNTEDFRPNVYEYDESFVNILFDNDIHKLIKDTTHKDLWLAHIQLRRVFPGSSYMNWHRDTHFKDGGVVSCSPPAYKLMFCPDVYDNKVPCTSLLKGTQICHLVNQKSSDFISSGFSQFDKQLLDSNMFEKATLSCSKNQFVFFDTSMLHAAEESRENLGSLRLIYVFVDREQFIEKYSHKKEHSDLNDIFQEKQLMIS